MSPQNLTAVSGHPSTRSHLRLFSWFAWPVATVVFGGLPFFVVGVASIGALHPADASDPIRTLGLWAEPAFASGFDALAVFGTLIVAVAAITGFSGDWSRLTGRARNLFSTLTGLAALLLLALASLTPVVIAASPGTSSHTVLLWLAGWGVMLVTLAISEVLPLRSQVAIARARALRAERRVEKVGYSLPSRDELPPARPTGALIALFGVPTGLWVMFSAGVAVAMNGSPRLGALFAFFGYGVLITIYGWTMRSDASSPGPWRAAAFALTVCGIVVTFAFAFASATVSGVMSVGLWMMGGVSLTLVLPLSVTRRIPVLRQVQAWRTFFSLQLLRERSEFLRRQWQRRVTPRKERPTKGRRTLRIRAR